MSHTAAFHEKVTEWKTKLEKSESSGDVKKVHLHKKAKEDNLKNYSRAMSEYFLETLAFVAGAAITELYPIFTF